jgi:hypothetical protein
MQSAAIIKLPQILALLLTGLVSYFFITNIDFFAVPDPDIFQYFGEGRKYLQLSLPTTIQVLPAYPILIGIISRAMFTSQYPELLAAHLITVFSAITLLLLVFQFLKKYASWTALLCVALLSTNPLYVFSSLNVNTEVLFTAASLVVFMLYQLQKRTEAYLAAGLICLIRYEGFVLLSSLFLADLFSSYGVKNAARLAALGCVPIILWMMITHAHNPHGNLSGNFFMREILRGRENIPQFMLYERIPTIVVNQSFIQGGTVSLISILVYILLMLGSIPMLMGRGPLRVAWIFGFIYLVFHAFFPYAPDRYLYPILWILYTTLIMGVDWCAKRASPFVQFIGILAAIVATAGNILLSYEYLTAPHSGKLYSRYARHEVRDAAAWLNNQSFSQPVYIFTYEPWLPEYFTKHPQVKFVYMRSKDHRACDSVECLIITSGLNPHTNTILYIQQSDSLRHGDSFPSAIDFNVKIFNEPIVPQNHPHFIEVAHLSTADTWAKIYQYIPAQ